VAVNDLRAFSAGLANDFAQMRFCFFDLPDGHFLTFVRMIAALIPFPSPANGLLRSGARCWKI
jgi:hypothetical protein